MVEVGLVDRPDGVLVACLTGEQHLARTGRRRLAVQLDQEVRALHPRQSVIGNHQRDLIAGSIDFLHDLARIVGVFCDLHQEGRFEGLEVTGDGITHFVLILDAQNHKTAHVTFSVADGGSKTAKQVLPGSDSTDIDPLCRTTMSLTI